MFHEIWNNCLMPQINKFQWNSTHYETKNICFLKYISWNSLIVLREEMLRNFRCVVHVFPWFKQEDYNKLCEIYFLDPHWAINMLHAIYLWNMFYAICFVGVPCALVDKVAQLVSIEKVLWLFIYNLGTNRLFCNYP